MSLEQSDKEAAAVAVAPRVTLEGLTAKIKSEEYLLAGDPRVLTICVLTMQNGFTIVGKSAPAAVENFNIDLGKKFAREDAIRQAWAFEGYLLRERLHQAANPANVGDAK